MTISLVTCPISSSTSLNRTAAALDGATSCALNPVPCQCWRKCSDMSNALARIAWPVFDSASMRENLRFRSAFWLSVRPSLIFSNHLSITPPLTCCSTNRPS